MQYRENPRNGDQLSALGYGCMRFTRKGGVIDQEKADRELALALEKGVNYFDTAYIYPGSEACLGEFLRDHDCRERVKIATKLPQYRIRKTEDFERFFREELDRLQTDYVDYYLMHMLNDRTSWERLCALGLREWVEEKKKSGAVRNIGFSFHGGQAPFRELLDAYDWDFCQIQYNYLDEHAQAGVEGLRYAHEKGMPVIIMEPLRGGRLTHALPVAARQVFEKAAPGRSLADWGFSWLLNQREVTVVLSGMNDPGQVEENCGIFSRVMPDSLTEAEMEAYRLAVEAIRDSGEIGCTGCGYCQPCPRHVDIPTCFAIYNHSRSDHYMTALKEYMMCTTLRNVRTNASQCVGCGKCEEHCPQHLKIREELRKVTKRLETPVYRIGALVLSRVMKY